MTDGFSRLLGPVLQTVLEFQQGVARGDHPGLDETRERLLSVLDEADQKASASRELAADFALAKYALVYWIDEVLITSSWSHAAEWREHILEWDLYRQRLGGEAFYDRAREAESLVSTDPLETYLLCVCLGFQGRYAFQKQQLLEWVQRAYNRIAESNQHPDRYIPDDPEDSARGALEPLPGKSFLLSSSVLVSATLLTTLACFIAAQQWFG